MHELYSRPPFIIVNCFGEILPILAKFYNYQQLICKLMFIISKLDENQIIITQK